MKTIEQLKNRIKELGKQAAEYSHQAAEIASSDRKQSINLMRQARDASRRCQVLIGELQRQTPQN